MAKRVRPPSAVPAFHMGAPDGVLAISLPVQLPTDVPRKAVSYAPSAGALAPA